MARRLSFLELGGDPFGDIGDRLGLPVAGVPEPRGLLVAQLGEIDRPFAIILRVRLEDYPLDLVYQPIGDTCRRAKLFHELLGKIPGTWKRHMAVSVATIERRA